MVRIFISGSSDELGLMAGKLAWSALPEPGCKFVPSKLAPCDDAVRYVHPMCSEAS
jgi:hypothetical protein